MDTSRLKQNIRYHESEAYFYNAMHIEIFNIVEQCRLRKEIEKLVTEKGGSRRNLILDVGSGTGNVVNQFHKCGIRDCIVASDLSRPMLRENRAEYKVLCEAAHQPFKNGSFGIITSYSLLHHLPDLGSFLEEIGRMCSKNAIVFMDHEPFVARRKKTLKGHPFWVADIINWIPWLILNPRKIKRLLLYLMWGRKMHTRIARSMDNVELDTTVDTKFLFQCLMKHGFVPKLICYKNGCLVRGRRDFRGRSSSSLHRATKDTVQSTKRSRRPVYLTNEPKH